MQLQWESVALKAGASLSVGTLLPTDVSADLIHHQTKVSGKRSGQRTLALSDWCFPFYF